MTRGMLFTLLTAYSTLSFAALPPFFQDAKEMKAILDNKIVADKITSGRPIQSIERMPSDSNTRWQITVGPDSECRLMVQILPAPMSLTEPGATMVGPVPFEIQVGDLQCRSLDKKKATPTYEERKEED